MYFAEVVIEAIFQCMMNECNLKQFNEHCKEQLNQGLANKSKQQIDKNSDSKTTKKNNKHSRIDHKCKIIGT